MRDEKREGRRASRTGWTVWPSVLGALMLIGWLASDAAPVRAFVIPSGSMTPTLRPGDRVLVTGEPARKPRRGEIWVFRVRMPDGKRAFIKRVMGLPGETVEVRNGAFYVNGTPLTEPYLQAPPTYSVRPTRLGPDQYYVLGDNRDGSNDSHVMGPISARQLVGEARLRYWPLERAGGL